MSGEVARRSPMLLLALSCAAVMACGGGDSGSPEAGAERGGGSFPVTIEHKLGTAEIRSRPERVVALGEPAADIALALGVRPLGITGYYRGGGSPWFEERLEGAEVDVLNELGQKVPVEKVAALKPDVILAGSYWTLEQEYETLAKIAPVVGHVEGPLTDTWQRETTIAGRALGREDEARWVIAEVEDRIAQVRRDHPEFDGSTFSFSNYFAPDKIQTINDPEDTAVQILSGLGLELSPAVRKLEGNSGAQISFEQLGVLDADAMVMTYASEDLLEQLRRSRLFNGIPAVSDGRFVPVDLDVASAMRSPSVLSIPYALDALEPGLDRATR